MLLGRDGDRHCNCIEGQRKILVFSRSKRMRHFILPCSGLKGMELGGYILYIVMNWTIVHCTFVLRGSKGMHKGMYTIYCDEPNLTFVHQTPTPKNRQVKFLPYICIVLLKREGRIKERASSFTYSQVLQGTVLLYYSSSKIMSSINLNLPDTHAH